MSRVALCICTAGRPEGLRRLLDAVDALDHHGDLVVIVVDNDSGQGAALCRSIAPDFRWQLRWFEEARRGISFARNRAVAEALRTGPDHIAMLDDDEWPERGWLREMLQARTRSGADVIGGPVVPVFPDDQPAWRSLAALYGAHRPRHGSLEDCHLEAAGNFLARACCFQDLMPTPFDERFALSGGEDLVLFRRLAGRGYRMCWAPDAVVYEPVADERLSIDWLRRRQIQKGTLNVLVQRHFAPGWRAEAVRLAKTGSLLVLGGALYGAGVWHAPIRLRGSLMLWKARGKLAGHVGRHPEVYGPRHAVPRSPALEARSTRSAAATGDRSPC
ncbi:MAG TPA: glycosyltransferase [Geminicoccaceae bacterium]